MLKSLITLKEKWLKIDGFPRFLISLLIVSFVLFLISIPYTDYSYFKVNEQNYDVLENISNQIIEQKSLTLLLDKKLSDTLEHYSITSNSDDTINIALFGYGIEHLELKIDSEFNLLEKHREYTPFAVLCFALIVLFLFFGTVTLLFLYVMYVVLSMIFDVIMIIKNKFK